jgi:hypothetical protein
MADNVPRKLSVDPAKLRQLLSGIEDDMVRRWLEKMIMRGDWFRLEVRPNGGAAKKGGPAGHHAREAACVSSDPQSPTNPTQHDHTTARLRNQP